MALKVAEYLGYFCMQFSFQDLSKVAKSGRFGDVIRSLLKVMVEWSGTSCSSTQSQIHLPAGKYILVPYTLLEDTCNVETYPIFSSILGKSINETSTYILVPLSKVLGFELSRNVSGLSERAILLGKILKVRQSLHLQANSLFVLRTALLRIYQFDIPTQDGICVNRLGLFPEPI